MSQIPPQGQGWVDGNGTHHPGFPPPGFWQASDSRWYPPETADPAYFATQPEVPPSEAPTQAVAPGTQPPGPGPAVPPTPNPGFGQPPRPTPCSPPRALPS